MLFVPGSDMMKDYKRNQNLSKRGTSESDSKSVGYKELKADNHSQEKFEEIRERQALLAKQRNKANRKNLLILLGIGTLIIIALLYWIRLWING